MFICLCIHARCDENAYKYTQRYLFDYLDAYAVADIPESEGLFAGGSFDFLKLASSAGNIANKKIVSSESFIKIDFDYNKLKIEDYQRLAGNAFAAGINQIVFHGYPYELSY